MPQSRLLTQAARQVPSTQSSPVWHCAPEVQDGAFTYAFRDTLTGVVFAAYAAQMGPGYGAQLYDLAARQPISEANTLQVAVSTMMSLSWRSRMPVVK